MPRKAKRDCENNPLETGEHAGDVRAGVVRAIARYFTGRKGPRGRRLSPTETLTEENVKTVLRTPFDDATFQYIHARCLPRVVRPARRRDPTMPPEVRHLLVLVGRLKSLKVPKDFQPGMLLLHFKLCHGLEIPVPPQ